MGVVRSDGLVEEGEQLLQFRTAPAFEVWNLNNDTVVGEAFDKFFFFQNLFAGGGIRVHTVYAHHGRFYVVERMPQEVNAENR